MQHVAKHLAEALVVKVGGGGGKWGGVALQP